MAKKEKIKPAVVEETPAPIEVVELVPILETPEPEIEEAPIIESAIEEIPDEPKVHPVGVRIQAENDEPYTIQAGDLNNYPELSEQGVHYGQKVKYGSLYVLKSAIRGGDKQPIAWPTSVSSKIY